MCLFVFRQHSAKWEDYLAAAGAPGEAEPVANSSVSSGRLSSSASMNTFLRQEAPLSAHSLLLIWLASGALVSRLWLQERNLGM